MRSTIGKKDLASRVSVRYHNTLPKRSISTKVLLKVFGLFLDEIFLAVSRGETVTINGFGSFSAAKHKGHPVQFGGGDAVEDYMVFRFSSSRVLNQRLRDTYMIAEQNGGTK